MSSFRPVTCTRARRVARGWRAGAGCGDLLDNGKRRTCRVLGLRCRSKDVIGQETSIGVACFRYGKRRVDFIAGS